MMEIRANYYDLNQLIRWTTANSNLMSKSQVIADIIDIVNSDKLQEGASKEYIANNSGTGWHYTIRKENQGYIFNANGTEFNAIKNVSIMDTNIEQPRINTQSVAHSENNNSSVPHYEYKQSKMYDLQQLNSIPLEDICHRYGIDLEDHGTRYWGKLRPSEKSASFSIRKENNLWYDQGISKGGNALNLVAFIENISPIQAIGILAQMYGIKPMNNENDIYTWRPLTDGQYTQLGVFPSRAVQNMKIMDSEKYTPEKLAEFCSKYDMTMGELATEYPKVYNSVMKTVAFETINSVRLDYYAFVIDYYKTTNETEKQLCAFHAKDYGKELNGLVGLLNRGVTDNSNYDFLKANVENDLKEFNKDISMGNISYGALKKTGDLAFKLIPLNEYTAVNEQLTEKVKYAAYLKPNGDVNLAFNKNDTSKVQNVIDRNKSHDISNNLDNSSPELSHT